MPTLRTIVLDSWRNCGRIGPHRWILSPMQVEEEAEVEAEDALAP